MPEYTYKAQGADGKVKKGNITAENKEYAIDKIREDGLLPIEVVEATALTREMEIYIGNPVSPRELSVFCRQFVSMLNAGVTLINALEMLNRQTSNKALGKALKVVEQDIMKGETLAKAMSRHPKIFPEIMVNMVAAGEAAGKLDIAFDRMASHFEKSAKTKGMIKKAAMYPIVVAVVAAIVIVIMLVKVIPAYREMFDSMGVDMPKLTMAVINASDFLVAYWYIVLGVIVAIVVAVKAVTSTSDGRYFFDSIKVKVPLFGQLSVKSAASLFARTLSTLVYSGLPLVEALSMTADTMDNEVFKRALRKSCEDVSRGVALSQSLKKQAVFPPMVDYMVSVGEETGDIEGMLERLANYYDEEVEQTTETVMAALEPMIILILAAIVGVLIGAVMSPMLTMYTNMENL